MANAQHSAATPEHGTPPEYLDLARYALGCEQFDLDPASNGYWNHHLVQAKTFFDRQQDGLKQQWRGFLWLNPSGGENDEGGLPRQFWRRLVDFWRVGAVHSAVWMGYSLEQTVGFQSCPVHPLQLFTAVPPNRIGFMTRPANGAPPERSKSPTHGNYITLLQTRRDPAEAKRQCTRFLERASSLMPGMQCAIVRPV